MNRYISRNAKWCYPSYSEVFIVTTLLQADYRQDGHEELICCSVDGEVRGYLPVSVGSGGHSNEHRAFEELCLKKQVMDQAGVIFRLYI